MTERDFDEALARYDPLNLAVYSPSFIPLSERKRISKTLFCAFIGDEPPKSPKWFEPLFRRLTASDPFKRILETCQGNPLLSAQLTAETVRILDKTIEELLKALKSWLDEQEKKKQEAVDRPAQPPAPEGSGSGSTATAASAGIPTSAAPVGISGELQTGVSAILSGLSLLPVQQPKGAYDDLPSDMKNQAESTLDESLNKRLAAMLALAEEWNSLYEMLLAIRPGLGWDYSPGFLKHQLLDKYLELSKLLSKVPELKELALRLGRYQSLMGEKVWDPTARGKSEVFSVECSDDIARVLPAELVQLERPTTKYLFYAKLADKSLLTYELRGEGWTQPEKHERGPVVICIDTSGSMAGLPESLAKAVSLAVAKETNSQGRAVHMILFGSRSEVEEFTFDRSEDAIDSLLGFLNLSFGGGTDFDSALRAALAKLEDSEFRLADVLFVTDGIGEIGQMEKELNSVKEKQGTRVFTLLIQSERPEAALAVSDETWVLNVDCSTEPSMATLRSKIREPIVTGQERS